MKSLILTVLLAHGVFGAYVAMEHGYLSVFPPFKETPTLQIFCDLIVSLGITLLLIARDRKKVGLSLRPLLLYGIGAILLGSISPLIYLLLEKDSTAVDKY